MISLESLVHAIQVAVDAASDAVMNKNLGLIDTFFVDADEAQDATESARAAIGKAGPASDAQAAAAAAREAANAAIEAVAAVRALTSGDQPGNHGGDDTQDGQERRVLKPRMVLMQFPNDTPDGPVIHTVHVPLISLVPLPQHQISELKFTTLLDLSIVQDKVVVGFPSAGLVGDVGGNAETGFGDGKNASPKGTSRVEVTITATATPKGFVQVIEGYNRALRAQIPN
jgi:hypothetical protein